MEEVRGRGAPGADQRGGALRALACGFLWLAAETGLPLRLLELGSSAGLNLRWDSFHYHSGTLEFGDPGSPVDFRDFLTSGSPPVSQRVEVARAQRVRPPAGGPTTEDGVLTLRSYLWADQVDRLELLDGAIAVAGRVPAEVERADTVEWLQGRLSGAAAGRAGRVPLDRHAVRGGGERERIRRRSRTRGRGPRSDSPIARLELEPGGEEAELRVTLWPGGERRVLGHAGYHGVPVRWTA